MIEITPVQNTVLSCTPCVFGSSTPGSSKCNPCPFNNYPEEKTMKCIECPVNSVAYPGSKSCSPRPECSKIYDIIPVYGPCNKGKRTIKYEFRKESLCNKNTFVLPTNLPEIECESCNPGSFIQNTGFCSACKEGEFTTTINSKQCTVCPPGKFTTKAEIFANFETLPKFLETNCEKIEGIMEDLCSIHKGWIIANKAITILPYTPTGVRLHLSAIINVIEKKGSIRFKYQGDATELFKLVIDGEITSKLLLFNCRPTCKKNRRDRVVYFASWNS